MNILGLSFDYHDAAAALIVDGRIVAAAQEERFSRIKHDVNLPKAAALFCLSHAGLSVADLDAVVYYEDPLIKYDRVMAAVLRGWPATAAYHDATMRSWVAARKFEPLQRIAAGLGVPADRIHHVMHHQAHAGAAFFCSAFDAATIITLDGVGEYETGSVSLGRGTGIDRLYSFELPHSLGLFYSAFTAFLGFEVNEGEYKVMGMAGFGEPRYAEKVRGLIEFRDDGKLFIKQDCFEFLCPGEWPFNRKFLDLFGPAREPGDAFDVGDRAKPPADKEQEQCRYYADIAASLQSVTEDAVLHVVKHAVKTTGMRDVCFAGGVALNGLANRRIQEEAGGRLYVHPAAGDSGGAAGAALYYYHVLQKQPRAAPLEDVFLGQAYGREDIEATLSREHITTFRHFDSQDEMMRQVAQKIADGAIVGWFQGRFEWGPRALGARSILADPTRPEMKAIVNEKIKFREPFRPFAPAVLAERAAEYFEMADAYAPSSPEHFMLTVSRVKQDKRAIVPAITHVDGTARVQLVRADRNPLFHALISEFAKIKNVPVLMNTSFNLRGEPIVCTPHDALMTFSWSDMDYLVLGQILVWKETPACV